MIASPPSRLARSLPCALTLAAGAWLGCATPPPEVIDRVAADRTPLSAACDDRDPGRCLLPWPSNALTVADPATDTGLRLAIETRSLNPRDDATLANRADGFSRVSSILLHFERPLDEATLGALHLVVAQPGHPARGREVPLRRATRAVDDGQTLLIGDPLEVLDPATDYLVFVDDTLTHDDGAPVSRPAAVGLALDLAEPVDEVEAALVGYHAPQRALLAELSVDPTTVRRLSDFTTRSAEPPRALLDAIQAACVAALPEVGVEIDRVDLRPDEPLIAASVVLHLTGVPTFRDEDGAVVVDAMGRPMQTGVTDVPFRVMIPAGEGDYRFALYGHGTGGHERDESFDTELAAGGIAKVGVRLYAWTDDEVFLTFAELKRPLAGAWLAATSLVEALAHANVVQRAMEGVVGEALMGDTLGGVENPAAGRRADGSVPLWVGGSLGGTTGLVYGSANPEVRHAVLNVPGAAWSQWVWNSATFDLVHPLVTLSGRDDLDLSLGLAVAQTNLDFADGASFADRLADHPTAFLIQESIGDPILPNPGTEMVAIATGSAQVGGVLEPIEGLETADQVIEGSGITQFRSPPGSDFDVHGFAARDTPAGVAARAQITDFIETVYRGEARIVPPALCPEGCDFGE